MLNKLDDPAQLRLFGELVEFRTTADIPFEDDDGSFGTLIDKHRLAAEKAEVLMKIQRQETPRIGKAEIGTQAASCLSRMLPHERDTCIDEAMQLAGEAYRRQGTRAFDYPKSAAAAHEAGHAVEYAASGLIVRSIRIYPAKWLGRRVWLGVADGPPGWRVDPTTPFEEILAQARHQIAGWVGEIFHEGLEFRQGSSLDEVVLFRKLIRLAAFRLGLDAGETAALGFREITRVMELLAANATVHRALTSRLIRDRAVRGKCLARLLAPVADKRVREDFSVAAVRALRDYRPDLFAGAGR